MVPIRDTTIGLRDGRSLVCCEWGHARDPVVLAFDGSPGSRVWWPGEARTKAAGRGPSLVSTILPRSKVAP